MIDISRIISHILSINQIVRAVKSPKVLQILVLQICCVLLKARDAYLVDCCCLSKETALLLLEEISPFFRNSDLRIIILGDSDILFVNLSLLNEKLQLIYNWRYCEGEEELVSLPLVVNIDGKDPQLISTAIALDAYFKLYELISPYTSDKVIDIGSNLSISLPFIAGWFIGYPVIYSASSSSNTFGNALCMQLLSKYSISGFLESNFNIDVKLNLIEFSFPKLILSVYLLTQISEYMHAKSDSISQILEGICNVKLEYFEFQSPSLMLLSIEKIMLTKLDRCILRSCFRHAFFLKKNNKSLYIQTIPRYDEHGLLQQYQSFEQYIQWSQESLKLPNLLIPYFKNRNIPGDSLVGIIRQFVREFKKDSENLSFDSFEALRFLNLQMALTNISTITLKKTSDQFNCTCICTPIFHKKYEQDNEWRYVYHYRISIENNNDKSSQNPQSIQLIGRHWIFSTNGEHDDIVVPKYTAGIVGSTPVLVPGESLEYMSSVALKSESGVMEGAFLFENKSNGERFQLPVEKTELKLSNRFDLYDDIN